MSNRPYDAHIGRALSLDPIINGGAGQDGANRYAYAYNHPTTLVDPNGFCSISVNLGLFGSWTICGGNSNPGGPTSNPVQLVNPGGMTGYAMTMTMAPDVGVPPGEFSNDVDDQAWTFSDPGSAAAAGGDGNGDGTTPASQQAEATAAGQAAAEFQVRAPLKEVGLTKAEIRKLSAQLGLPTADKPQMACLSSRVPYGENVSPEKLRMIERAEYVLHDLGFHEVRVRHHELQKQNLARIELPPAEIPALLANGKLATVAEELKKIGYAHVTLDLQGYRRGSTNEVLGGK